MLPRFFAPDVRSGESVVLSRNESQHLIRVLRLKAGAEVIVFDGRGHEAIARVERVTRDAATVRPIESVRGVTESSVRMTLAQAVLKGDKMDEVVRDATMLGVAALQPLVTARTNVSLAALRRGKTIERWRRIAVASAKQCGRAAIPDVHPPVEFRDLLRVAHGMVRVILVEPEARIDQVQGAEKLRDLPKPPAAIVAVGPEGGWTDAELRDATEAGFWPLTFGRRTLRADAAPLIAMAVLQFVWGDL